MNKHSKIFFKFIDEMHDKDIPYVIFRGFGKLPAMPDKDIDMVGSFENYDKIFGIKDNKARSKPITKSVNKETSLIISATATFG